MLDSDEEGETVEVRWKRKIPLDRDRSDDEQTNNTLVRPPALLYPLSPAKPSNFLLTRAPEHSDSSARS
jgi:hypothetical protein